MDKLLKNQQDETHKYASVIDKFIYGNWPTCIVYTFAELAIADLLYQKPAGIDEISNKTQTDPAMLKRFFSCAANLGLLRTSENLYYLTPMGEFLCSDHPQSRRDAARLNGAAYRYQPWGHLVEILRQGDSLPFSPSCENGTLDYLSEKPALLKVFHDAMTRISDEENLPIVSSYDFSRFKNVVDIGCGQGGFMKTILSKNNHIRGIMFDLESTLSTLEDNYENRLDRISGDFFCDPIPCADLYILKNVIHNWNEEKALMILKNIYSSMSSAGNSDAGKRLLIIENTIKHNDDYNVANWMDLNFMILVNGAERTLEDYQLFVKKAGFVVVKVISTPAGRDILELAIEC